jgi:hypothetical protein
VRYSTRAEEAAEQSAEDGGTSGPARGLTRRDKGPLNPGCNGFVPLETCATKDWGRRPGLVVWGDSHAARFVSLALAYAGGSGVPVLQRSSIACPPLRDVVPTQEEDRPNLACGGFNRSVEAEVERLAASGQVSGVMLVGRWNNYLAPKTGRGGIPRRLVIGGRVEDAAGSARALETGLRRRLEQLARLRLRVLVVAQVPEYPWAVPHCVVVRGPDACRIERARAIQERASAIAALRSATNGLPGVRLFDPMDAVCDAEWCNPAPGGNVLYSDQHHLTARAAGGLLPRAREDLRWLDAGPPG